MRVDVHSHFVPPLPDFRLDTAGDRWPRVTFGEGRERRLDVAGQVSRTMDATYWSVEARLERLHRTSIDLQVMSPLPALLPWWATGGSAAEWCAAVNEGIANAVAEGEGRLRGFGIVPVQDSSRVPAVWEQARSLGLIGVELGTAVDAARLLSHDDVDDSLRYLADESVPVLVHPNRPGTLGKVSPRLERGLAWPTDTAAVVAARIERARSAPHPRACLSHGGGPLLWEWTRLFGARRDDDVAIPDWMYVDTALCSGAQVEYLIRVLGPDRVLFGSDQPAIDDDVMADHANSMPTSWPGLAGKAPAEAFLGISL